MKKPIVLRIFKNEQLLGIKQFLVPQVVIGRASPEAELQVALEGESVSVIHASIEEREDELYYVSDLGSVGGTQKNGQLVLDSPIESGDVLQVGDYKIEFFLGAPKPKTGHTAVQAVAPTPAPASTPAPTPAPAPAPVAAPKPASPAPPQQNATSKVSATTAANTSTNVPQVEPTAAAPTSTPPSKPTAPVQPQSFSIQPKVIPTIKPANAPANSPTPHAAPPASASASASTPKGSGAVAGTGAIESHVTGQPIVGPKTKSAFGPPSEGAHRKTRKKKTFAPPSKYSDVKEFVKPSKGTVVEVLVAWRERVIGNYHFSQAKTITIGAHPDNDIVVPLLASNVRKLPIMKIDKQAIVLIGPDLRGEVVRGQTNSSFTELMRQNRLAKSGTGYTLALDQGEMAKVELSDQVSVIIRYVSDSPKPLVAPIFDFTAVETTGVVLALALVATLWLYMTIQSPPRVLPGEEVEPLRTALIVLTPPTPVPLPPPPPPEPPKPPEKPQPTPPPKVTKVKLADSTREAVKKAAPTATNLTTKADPGKSANAAPKNKTGPKELTSVKQGGSIKQAKSEGSQMKSKPARDVTKSGVFSVFGNQGQQDKLAQGTTGSGELAGMADAATGKTGSATDRAGKGLGSELKDTGAGGTGKSLEGIAGGIGTKGRGSGQSGYGTGGLGNKAGVTITPGGSGVEISGTIDREAIRRVILANLKVIRACYERELNRKPDLFGKIVLSWDIGEQGRVVGTRVKSNELGSKAVADCIMDRLRTWRFPEPPNNQVVEIEAYPFLFSN